MGKFYSPILDLDHDHELAAALGQMVVAWAGADDALVCAFTVIGNMDPDMALVAYYRIPSFEARTKVILAMCNEWHTDKAEPEALRVAVEKLTKLAKARNDWIHGNWCTDDGKTETIVFDYRVPKDAARRRKLVKVHDVNDHVQAVRRRTTDLLKLVKPLWDQLLASRRKAAQQSGNPDGPQLPTPGNTP